MFLYRFGGSGSDGLAAGQQRRYKTGPGIRMTFTLDLGGLPGKVVFASGFPELAAAFFARQPAMRACRP